MSNMPVWKFLAVTSLLGSIVYCVAQTPDLVKRGASVTLKVPSYASVQQDLSTLAAKHQGLVADKRNQSSDKGQRNGWFRLYVPKDQLDSLLAEVRALGTVYGEQNSLVDQAGDYADLGKRIERLKQHQERLSGVLGSKKLRGSDILFIQERLLRAGMDEDSLSEQRAALAAGSSRSSVIVTVFEPGPSDSKPHGMARLGVAFKAAAEGLVLSIVDGLGTLVHLVLWAIALWIGWLIFRRPIKRGYAKLAQMVDPPNE